MKRIREEDIELCERIYIRSESKNVMVYKGKIKQEPGFICVKKLEVLNCAEASQKIQECFGMLLLKHENIVPLHSCLLSGKGQILTTILLIMDYFPEGDLSKLIKKRKENSLKWTEKELLEFARQLISACLYMQSQGIAHRDIKSENIFVTNEGTVLKIADFGCVTDTDRDDFTLVGTPAYLTPQIYQLYKSNHGKNAFPRVNHNATKTDVYALGLVLLNMATLLESLYINQAENFQENLDCIFQRFSQDYRKIKKVLMKMLIVNENDRPDFVELQRFLEEVINEPTCEACGIEYEESSFYNFEDRKMCKSCLHYFNTYPKQVM